MMKRLRSRFMVLCTALLLWQTGLAPWAHAAAAHGSGHDASAVPAAMAIPQDHADVAQMTTMPCHGDEVAASSPAAIAPHPHASLADDMGSASTVSQVVDGADCCQSLDCRCACVHASLNAVTIAVLGLVVPDHPAVLGADLPVLRARIAELFKPPI